MWQGSHQDLEVTAGLPQASVTFHFWRMVNLVLHSSDGESVVSQEAWLPAMEFVPSSYLFLGPGLNWHHRTWHFRDASEERKGIAG